MTGGHENGLTGVIPMTPVKDFRRLESAGGIVLMVRAVLAIIAANSPLAGVYGQLPGMPLTVAVGEAAESKPIVLWINDGLMAIFFLLIGLELKLELLDGELSTARRVGSPCPHPRCPATAGSRA